MAMDLECEPNSAGYWRRNSIMALREMSLCCIDLAADPEEWESRRREATELANLQAREAAVQQRYKRMLARKSG